MYKKGIVAKVLVLALASSNVGYSQSEREKKSETMENVLLAPFDTKHGTAPFSRIQLEDYKPAVEEGIRIAKEEVDAIIANQEAPTFENTIEALEFSGMLLDRVTSIFFNLNSAETTPEMQALAQEISPMVTAHGNDITLNEALFERIKSVYDRKEEFNLTPEQALLLEKKYNGFVRNGALLDEDGKQRLREIDGELSKLSLTFNENVLKETQDFILHLENEEDLSGLPEGVVEAAAEEAKSRELEGWVFTLDYPSYVPFVTYADNRDLRKKMSVAFGARSNRNNDNDNKEIIKKITNLRHQRAQLLGYESHASFKLEDRMAENPDRVYDFLNDLLEKATPAAEKEFAQLTKFAQERDGISQLEKWDGAYYSEKLKQELFRMDDEALKPYFELNSVLDGAFEIANRLFGIEFKPVEGIDVYHPDVKTYEVYDENGNFLSVFYADFHPRKGKRAGAWMTAFKDQYILDGENSRPHIANVCNFTKPTSSKPSLLSFNEVTTLFHEFGHGLHGMLANTTYPSLSGTSVSWDFVELPSQLMENWCYEPEALALFAKHYETGEAIPQEYIDNIKASANFMEGLATLRQLSFGLLDMAYHAQDPSGIEDIKSFESKIMKPASLYPDVEENMMSTMFSHIFAGGYSAGYYSYKWAEVLDADAFAYFAENGIFNRDIARKFQETVLSKGGSVHPMELYKQFRGQEPSPDALLIRAGLMPASVKK